MGVVGFHRLDVVFRKRYVWRGIGACLHTRDPLRLDECLRKIGVPGTDGFLRVQHLQRGVDHGGFSVQTVVVIADVLCHPPMDRELLNGVCSRYLIITAEEPFVNRLSKKLFGEFCDPRSEDGISPENDRCTNRGLDGISPCQTNTSLL